MKKIFVDHPASVGESYAEHLLVAGSFGWRMVFAGLACLVHGLLPFLFVTTGSRTIRQLHGEMVTHRQRKPVSDAPRIAA